MRISLLGERLLAFQKGLCCTSYRRLLKVGVRKPTVPGGLGAEGWKCPATPHSYSRL